MKNNNVFEKIKKEKFNNFFKQLNLIIINWGDPIKYSLHIASGVRVCHGDKIIFNLSDDFLTKEGVPKDRETFERLESEGVINDPDSLLAKNVANVNRLLKGEFAKKVEVSKWLDMAIVFSDDVIIQIVQDYSKEDFEYYRLIEFVPHYDDDDTVYSDIHYVVKNKKGIPTLIKEV